MAYNDLLGKVEAAIKTVLDALSLTGTRGTDSAAPVSILTGLDDDNAAMPRVVIYAKDSGPEITQDTGIFPVTVIVTIHSHSADETLSAHRERVGSVIDGIMQDNRSDVLTAAVTDFHCYALQDMGPSEDVDGHAFKTSREFLCTCCAADLT